MCLFLLPRFGVAQTGLSACGGSVSDITAVRVEHEISLNAQNPAKDWQSATPVTFCGDWQGKNPDPGRETQVRALWTLKTLYLRYECRYRTIHVFDDSAENGRRDQLWDRDVAEAFLQPNPSRERFYKEFEVSPNGMWVDLDISPELKADLRSGLTRSVAIDEKQRRWTAELAIPLSSLTANFDPKATWRVNFFRVEGAAEPRFYSAWQPTKTEKPNFHVPSVFGRMHFVDSGRSGR
jgi:alpha-galactosidase